MSARKSWIFIGLALLSLGAAHSADVSTREALVRRFLAGDSEATVGIIEHYGLNTRDCHFEPMNDVHALAAALITTETLATPQLNGWMRRAVVHIARLTGVVPDISIGPGRIKLTTARAALRESKSESMQSLGAQPDAGLAQQLFDACTSARVAVAILDSIPREEVAAYDRLDRKFVRKAAARYNGQVDAANRIEAGLSNEIYLQLVYEAYQYYRFLSLTTR